MTVQLPPVLEEPPPPTKPGNRLRIALVVAAVLALVALTVVVLRGDDETQTPPGTTPAAPTTLSTPAATTAAPSTSAAPSGTASPSTTVAPPAEVDTATVVWPVKASAVRYTDPVAAARGFATDYVGFSAPVVGGFMQGDSRSGEVEVRPRATGPVTTVLVRKLEDGTWWVPGAAATTIRLDSPSAGAAVSSPVRLIGAAHTFEGHVTVTIREDGVPAPLGTGYVTGAGDRMGPFDGEVPFARAPVQRYGAILLAEHSAENGQLWQVSVVRVRLTG
jgi:hypothetical protein